MRNRLEVLSEMRLDRLGHGASGFGRLYAVRRAAGPRPCVTNQSLRAAPRLRY